MIDFKGGLWIAKSISDTDKGSTIPAAIAYLIVMCDFVLGDEESSDGEGIEVMVYLVHFPFTFTNGSPFFG